MTAIRDCFFMAETSSFAAMKGLKAKESVIIGNDEFADVRGGMAAGLEACYIQTEQSPTVARNLPCQEIKSLLDLLD